MASVISRISSLGKAGSAQALKGFFELLQLLEGPRAPLFVAHTEFVGEEARLSRLFITSTMLTGIPLGINQVVSTWDHKISTAQFQWIVWFTVGAALYSLYSKWFSISLTIRQLLFVFSLVLLPWIPLVMSVKIIAEHFSFGPLFLIVEYSLFCHILWLLASGVSIVAQQKHRIVTLSSFVMAIVVVVAGYLMMPHAR